MKNTANGIPAKIGISCIHSHGKLIASIAFSLFVCVMGLFLLGTPLPEANIGLKPVQASIENKAEWIAKIDTALQGSTLEGHGKDFVSAAMESNVDVRLSVAIALAETQLVPSDGKFNVWNWNGRLGDNWEDAICAHTQALSKYCDGALSNKTAQIYAPNEWESWEQRVASYMQALSAGNVTATLEEIPEEKPQGDDTDPDPSDNAGSNDTENPSETEDLTDIQHKIINLAFDPPDALDDSENAPLTFVNELYQLAGAKSDMYSCAHEAMDKTLLNPNLSDVPIGACLFSESQSSSDICICGRTPGDICVYVGNGKVACVHDDKIETENMNTWIERATEAGGAVSWGWLGNHELLTPSGEPAVDDENGPIKAWTTEVDGTHVYWTVVSPGHTPKLAIKSGAPDALARQYGAAVATNFTTNSSGEFSLAQRHDTLSGRTISGGDLFYLDATGWWNSFRGKADMISLNAVVGGYDNGWHVVAVNGKNLASEMSGDVEGPGIKHPRTWIGQKTSGEFFSCVCDGMRPAETGCAEPGMTIDEMYDFTVEYICGGDPSQIKIMYNTDGGSSSAFVVNGKMESQCFGKGTRAAILYYTASSCEFKEWKGSYDD